MDIEKELLRYKLKGYVLESNTYIGISEAQTWFASTPPNSGDYLKEGLFDKTYSRGQDINSATVASIRKMKKYGY